MFKRFFPTFLAPFVIAGWFMSLATAEPTKKAPADVRPALTEELNKWVSDGDGKLTEDDVTAKLGLPDLVENPIDPDSKINPVADITMVWQDISLIEVTFKDGKAKQISGRFSPHITVGKVTLANFRKLKTGAEESDVAAVLGMADSKTELTKGTTRYEWAAKRIIKVNFKGGKVTGVAWEFRNPLG
jgi:hypothetical protein